MSNKYKLTTSNYKTRPWLSNETTWVVGRRVCAEDMRGKPRPCSNTVIHYYHSPLQAVFFSPLHCLEEHTKLIEVKCSEELGSDGAKGWCRGAIMIHEVELPELTIEQRVTIAIRCALLVCDNAEFIRWAKRWLSGEDRSREAARAAYWVAQDSVRREVGEAAPVEGRQAAYWAAVMAAIKLGRREVEQAAYWAAKAAYLVAGNIDIESILQEVAQ